MIADSARHSFLQVNARYKRTSQYQIELKSKAFHEATKFVLRIHSPISSNEEASSGPEAVAGSSSSSNTSLLLPSCSTNTPSSSRCN
mmetsp:Transcript_20165/g.24866  ORF Transcript_20165/g.24866 Transcript_20165/m.24866 type:complete len:87 (-) Transcript_20165:194-454(-)